MKDLIKEKNEAVQNYESEILGIKKETKTENEKNAQLLDQLNKFEKELEMLDAKMKEILAEKKQLLEQKRMLEMS